MELGDITEVFPAFVTMLGMVLCYSIADGISLGIISFVVLKLFTGRRCELSPILIVLALLFIVNFIVA
jgi:adenine/guanine/hypoxanthine permease